MKDAFLAELRANDPERYLLSLFYPPPARPHVWAVTAFAAEIARIPDIASEEMIGLIRLAWWREALDTIYAGGAVPPHPIARRLAAMIAECQPPRLWFDAMLEAREEQIEGPRIPDLSAFHRFAQSTAGMLARLSMLTMTRDAPSLEAAGEIGAVYGLLCLMRSLPHQLLHGYCLLPADLLAQHGLSPEALIEGKARTAAFNQSWTAFRADMLDWIRRQHFATQSESSPPLDKAARHVNDRWIEWLEKGSDPLETMVQKQLSGLPFSLLWTMLLTKS